MTTLFASCKKCEGLYILKGEGKLCRCDQDLVRGFNVAVIGIVAIVSFLAGLIFSVVIG